MMHKLGLAVAARWLEPTQTGWGSNSHSRTRLLDFLLYLACTINTNTHFIFGVVYSNKFNKQISSDIPNTGIIKFLFKINVCLE